MILRRDRVGGYAFLLVMMVLFLFPAFTFIHAETSDPFAHVVLSPVDPDLTSPSGTYRWLDVADQVYGSDYRDSYNYSQATVEVTYEKVGEFLNGTLIASNLKPNFAYQLKLVGTPGTEDNELIGLAGRWWQEEWDGSAWSGGGNLNNKGDGSSPNPNDVLYFERRYQGDSSSPTGYHYRYTGYLPFEYFITDSIGGAILDFETGSCYHVLWKTSQRGHTAADGPVKTVTFDPDPSEAAYDEDYPSNTVGIFGEWERLPMGGVHLTPSEYSCQIVLTEESFHGSGGEYAGNWAGALSANITFAIPPARKFDFDEPTDQYLHKGLRDVSPTGNSYMLCEHWGGWWSDAEKLADNTEDDLMCWAASASNILEWTGWGLVSGFWNEDQMFEHFQDHWTDEGSLPVFAWNWWFDGTEPPNWPGWSQVDVPGGGNFWPAYTFSSYYHEEWDDWDALSAVDGYLHSGYGVGLGIYTDTGGGHGITCWGYNYNPASPTDYYGIWVTDSDDYKHHTTTDPPPDMLRYYEVSYSSVNSRWHLLDFYGSDNWWIGGVMALEPFPNIRPVADAGGPYTSYEGSPIRFDGSDSSDTDPLQYRWDFDNDGVWDTSWSTNSSATNAWYSEYTGTVILQVYDGHLLDIDKSTITITIDPSKPIIVYNEETNTITCTGGTEPNPITFWDLWNASYQNGWNVSCQTCENATTGIGLADTQFLFDCKLQIGDGSATTWFADTNKQIIFVDGIISDAQKIFILVKKANFRLGQVHNTTVKTSSDGCSIIVLESDTQGKLLYVSGTGTSTVHIYSSHFHSNYLQQFQNSGYCTSRIWYSSFTGELQVYSSTVDMYDVSFSGLTTAYYSALRSITGSMEDIKILEDEYAIYAYTTDGGTFTNVVIRESTQKAFLMKAISTPVYLVDCDVDSWSFFWYQVSSEKLYRQYTFNLLVTNSTGFPVNNANCALYMANGTQVFSVNTGADGTIAEQTVSRGFYNQTGGNTLYDYGPFKLTVVKGAMSEIIASITLGDPVDWTVSLEEAGGGVPSTIGLALAVCSPVVGMAVVLTRKRARAKVKAGNMAKHMDKVHPRTVARGFLELSRSSTRTHLEISRCFGYNIFQPLPF